MDTNEALKQLNNKEFLNMIYGFSYQRCNTAQEAEDLCSEIILAVIAAIRRQEHIGSFHAFVWTVARRAYADYCRRRSSEHRTAAAENCTLQAPALLHDDAIESYIEAEAEREQLSMIYREIAFLSKAYRDVMVMHYLDGLGVKDIAARIGISETAVKQRLFSARNTVRIEVKSMSERKYVLKPVSLRFIGTGDPIGNAPQKKAERSFSQNLIYLCRQRPKTPRELSEELCIPMPFIEEELELQCRGENGSYGLLRRTDDGRYVTNFHLVDYEEFDQANMIYEKYLPDYCGIIEKNLAKYSDRILSFPYLSKQTDVHFIFWTLVCTMLYDLEANVDVLIKDRYFSDINPVQRDYTCVGIAMRADDAEDIDYYGSTGINARSVGGCRSVFLMNLYGERLEPHFDCGHNISTDGKLLMLLRSIGGLPLSGLSESDREFAARAIECGYVRRRGDIIEPNIVAIDMSDYPEFSSLAACLNEGTEAITGAIAAELSEYIRDHIPARLIGEYDKYASLIAGAEISARLVEACIGRGLLTTPENRPCAEGVILAVERA